MANYVKLRGEKGYWGFLIQKMEDKNWRKKIKNVE